MPNFGSRDLRDLINRMLQPNPVKRIKLKEIQSHPWYLQNLPKYLKSFSCTPMKYEMHVDTDIVRKLFEVSLLGKIQRKMLQFFFLKLKAI